jgi:glutamine synthetase
LIPQVADDLLDALGYLDRDRAFLTAGGVFSDETIDAYIDLKKQEHTLVNMTTHPLEFELYYSC